MGTHPGRRPGAATRQTRQVRAPFPPGRPGGAQAKRRGRCRRCRRSSECTEGSGQTAKAGGRRRRPRRARRRRARGGRGAGRFPGPKRGPRRAPVVRMESWAKKRRRRPIARAPRRRSPRSHDAGERGPGNDVVRAARRATRVRHRATERTEPRVRTLRRRVRIAFICGVVREALRRRAPPTRLVRIRGGRRTLRRGRVQAGGGQRAPGRNTGRTRGRSRPLSRRAGG